MQLLNWIILAYLAIGALGLAFIGVMYCGQNVEDDAARRQWENAARSISVFAFALAFVCVCGRG